MDDRDHDLHAGPPPIPILTGFLGAGKTTGLNRILTCDHGLRVAVLINGFGSITIDADLVVGVEGNVISLANGCICYTIRDDLISARRPLWRAALPVCLRAVDGTLEAVRVHGPSGRAKNEGTQAMAEGLNKMTHWHTKAFSGVPVGDEYEIEDNEFPWDDDGGTCYQKNGVTIRHWRRIHNMLGASAYRLDWNGLSFVWTSDGRPDELTVRMSEGVDVFVTELQMDTGRLMSLETGVPEPIYNLTIDAVHTDHYATGYMIKRVNPRIGMVTHMAYDHELINEAIAGVRVHWDGLFVLGAPDGVVVNVTQDAVWTRQAALPESANSRRPSSATELKQLFGGQIPDTLTVPKPVYSMTDLYDKKTLANEIPQTAYAPHDVQRPLVRSFRSEFVGKEIPLAMLFGFRELGTAVGESTRVQRSLVEALGILGAGIVGKVLPDSPKQQKAKETISSLSGIFEDALWRSDEVRRGLTTAVKDLAENLQKPGQQTDLRTAALALVEAAHGLGSILQRAEVREHLQRAVELFIDVSALQFRPEATSKGGTGLADTLGTTLGGFMTMISTMFPQTLAHAGGPLKIFAPILQAAVAGSDAQRGLESLLKAIGHALQDPAKRDRLKAVAGALIEPAGVIGGSLQRTSVRDDVQGDVESLVMTLTHQPESVSRVPNPQRR